MKYLKFLVPIFMGVLLLMFFNSCKGVKEDKTGDFYIGWSFVDITPEEPVLLHGQLYARVSEGVMDPITVTALALESGSGPSSEKTIMISADLCVIFDGTRDGSADNLRDNVRKLIKECLPDLDPEQIILNATHTHLAPEVGVSKNSKEKYGVDLDIMAPSDYLEFVSERIAKAAEQAWNARKPGGISYGLGYAVASHNRLQADMSGKSTMYFLPHSNKDFSHVEGYEDHSVNLLYTWDNKSNLTGMVINVASTSQASGSLLHKISADYWHDTRVELRRRLGRDIFILPQCSAAGDQAPHNFYRFDFAAEERMQKLMFPGGETGRSSIGRRKQIAMRISDAVTSVLPYMKDNIEWNPVFIHKMEVANLSRRLISMDDVNTSVQESENYRKSYEQMLLEIKENPEIKKEPRWYKDITRSFVMMNRGQSVKERYDLEKIQPKLPIEVHVFRIGDIVMATNPFELYLDYGIRIKGRSPAVQTFLVQLAGGGTYVPTSRSIAGGAYGAVPASTLIGPEGGQELVEETLELINSVWQTNE